MGFQGGLTGSVGTAAVPFAVGVGQGKQPISVCNAGTIPLWVGGPTMLPGQGLLLPVGMQPFALPVNSYVGNGNEDPAVTVTAGTNGLLSWVANV